MEPCPDNENIARNFHQSGEKPVTLPKLQPDLAEMQPGIAHSEASRIQARTLKGFRDMLPNEAIIKNSMLSTLTKVFETFGFLPIQTPHLEYTDCLFGPGGPGVQKQVYRFSDHGGRDVSLRFDLTVPLARFISEHRAKVGLPFKRWAIGSVFRGENTQKGRYREFTQCDFDFIGTDSLAADAEIVQVINASLEALGVKNFQIRVNNRKIMNGFSASLGCGSQAANILQEVDKLEKVGEEAVRESLAQKHGLSQEAITSLLEFVAMTHGELSTKEILERLAPFKSRDQLLRAGIEEIESLIGMLASVGIKEPRLKLDLSIARGLAYYTGIVYETSLLDLPNLGSVCSGGRYDNLTDMFDDKRCPGVGASVGIDRLIAGLDQLGVMPSIRTPARALLCVPKEVPIEQVMKLGAIFRELGLSVEVFPESASIKNQVTYARRVGHPYLVILEKDISQFRLENLETGDVSEFTFDSAGISEAASRLNV